MSWEEVNPDDFASPGAPPPVPAQVPVEQAGSGPLAPIAPQRPRQDPGNAGPTPLQHRPTAPTIQGVDGSAAQPASEDEEESIFGGKIDGLVYAQRTESPELRWQETQQRPVAKPLGPPPITPDSRRGAAPWEPGPRPVLPEMKPPSRWREAWLPVSVGLASLALVLCLSYAFMRMYGFI